MQNKPLSEYTLIGKRRIKSGKVEEGVRSGVNERNRVAETYMVETTKGQKGRIGLSLAPVEGPQNCRERSPVPGRELDKRGSGTSEGWGGQGGSHWGRRYENKRSRVASGLRRPSTNSNYKKRLMVAIDEIVRSPSLPS